MIVVMKQGVILVMPSFVGATQEGVTTTLGRGSSDFSAAILGDGLDADFGGQGVASPDHPARGGTQRSAVRSPASCYSSQPVM